MYVIWKCMGYKDKKQEAISYNELRCEIAFLP